MKLDRNIQSTDVVLQGVWRITDELSAARAAELEFSNDKLMGRIQRAEESRVHHILVVGQREQEANAVALRIHGQGQQGVGPRAEVMAEILAMIRERRP